MLVKIIFSTKEVQLQYAEQIGATRRNLSDLALVRNGAIAILIAEYVYAFSFNFLPDSFRFVFAGSLFLLNAVMAAIAYMNRQSVANNLILLSLVVTCAAWGLSYGFGYGGGGKGYTLSDAAKQTGVFMIAIWVLTYPEALPRRLLAVLASATLIGGGVYAAVAPPVEVAGEKFFALITGVPQSYLALVAEGDIYLLVGARHSSATFILLNIILVDQLRRLQVLPPMAAWLLILFGTFVIFGYVSRNNLVNLSIYFLAVFFYQSKKGGLVGPLYFLMLGFFIVFVLGSFFFVDPDELYYWGSGRIGTYVHRINVLGERELGSLLVGTGMGSDWFRSYTWWNTEKVSHNLFLSIIIEKGLLGIVSFAIFLMAIYQRLPRGMPKTFIYMIFVSGLLSHGLVADMQYTVIFFAAVAMAILATEGGGDGIRSADSP